MPKRLSAAQLLVAIFFAAVSAEAYGSGQPQKPATVPMATYSDPAGDISFDHPAVWKIDNSARFYLAPHILQGGLAPQVQVLFLPTDNYYAKTTLTDLVFVYAESPQPTEQACTALAVGSIPAKAETELINGVSFQHFDTGDAGMCHGADQHVYWTWRQSRQSAGGGTCYLFEGDMHTSCSGAYDGQRDLTAAETRALLRHLNAIPQSIRLQ